MHRANLHLLLIVVGVTCAVPRAAAAEGLAPTSGVQAVAHQDLVGLLNPMGAELRSELALRSAIGNQDDILFQGAHLQAGTALQLSPVYAIGGPYIEVQPFSFLVLRGEFYGAGIWPIGMSGAGHYGLSDYQADVRAQSLPAELGTAASGWMGNASLTLQGALDVGPNTRLVVLSELGLSFAAIGDADFYYSMRSDLVLAREDLLVSNAAILLIEQAIAPDLRLRFGAYDDLRVVPGSGYVGHQVGPVAMLEWQHPNASLASVTFFARAGGYTHHVVRRGEPTVLIGMSLDYSIGAL